MTQTSALNEDRVLLDRLRGGDEQAFDALFRAWYAPLVRVAEAMLHDRASAEEVAQDVMLELWRRRDTLDVHQSPRGYLIQATRNRALNQIRRARVERVGEPHVADRLVPPEHADAMASLGELESALATAVESLPDRCREVFELSRVRGLRYSEIAETMGISVKTVEVQMGKALRTLRERLAPWLPKGRTL